jgi:ABC-type dipeptide/oligopeptide/nickel transport system permease component
MLSFLLRRATAAVLTLVGVLALVFALMAAAPGDPATLAAHAGGARNVRISPEAVEAFHRLYGLDRPLVERFVIWIFHAVRFDFGRSFLDGREVKARIAETLPATLAVNAGALLLAVLIALPCGVASARRPGGRFDRLSGLVFDVLFAMPTFVLGMVFLLVFSVALHVTPLFADPGLGLRGLMLPVATLALASVAPLARFVRACVKEALEAPASAAARARGENPRGQVRRALRRSAGALAAMGAAVVPGAVAGSILVERLFALPGSGGLLADAVFARDIPTVLGLTLLVASVVVVSSLLADLASAALDPRTRTAESADAAAEGA